jgi:hypothetical protein
LPLTVAAGDCVDEHLSGMPRENAPVAVDVMHARVEAGEDHPVDEVLAQAFSSWGS